MSCVIISSKSLQSFTYSGVHWSGYIYPASQCENMRLYRRLLATAVQYCMYSLHHPRLHVPNGAPTSVCLRLVQVTNSRRMNSP